MPVKPQWRLNERHYGNLTGMVKVRPCKRDSPGGGMCGLEHQLMLVRRCVQKDVVREFGAEQVQIWRRSLDVPPPPMGKDHPLYDTIHSSRQFRGVPHIPATESLVDVRERLKVLLEGELADDLRQGKRVLICAHSNSLRALITLLEGKHPLMPQGSRAAGCAPASASSCPLLILLTRLSSCCSVQVWTA